MDEKIDQALSNLVSMVRTNIKADEALKYTQAALNLAHAKAVLEGRVAAKAKGP